MTWLYVKSVSDRAASEALPMFEIVWVCGTDNESCGADSRDGARNRRDHALRPSDAVAVGPGRSISELMRAPPRQSAFGGSLSLAGSYWPCRPVVS